ncbi:TPA: hypothetical protein QHY01_004478 [Enterobacter asburiae]|nr:hypothetical protein [Enterobacter asburiae]HDS6858520.1 hypothetical protein [Enterobacter asburiae]HDT3148522.1 hypothetical protein [Enterobacter asburiae]
MSTQPTIIELGSYRWPRHLAIHEAGHAIAAWFFGIQEVEIALSGNNRVAKTYLSGDVDECGAVAVWRVNYPRNVAEVKSYTLSNDDARLRLIEQVCQDMVSSLAGIVAQSRYTEDDIDALMETSGKADMKNVRDLSEVYRVAGGEDADIQRISLSRAQALITLKWWDVIALAKILENRNHMPARNFQRIMGDIDKPVPKPLTLAELDELVGEE